MAGIHTAKKMVDEKRDSGVVIASGKLPNYPRNGMESKFIVLRSFEPDTIELIVDYGSDIQIEDSIVRGDIVAAEIIDDYHAKWVKKGMFGDEIVD